MEKTVWPLQGRRWHRLALKEQRTKCHACSTSDTSLSVRGTRLRHWVHLRHGGSPGGAGGALGSHPKKRMTGGASHGRQGSLPLALGLPCLGAATAGSLAAWAAWAGSLGSSGSSGSSGREDRQLESSVLLVTPPSSCSSASPKAAQWPFHVYEPRSQ